MKPKKISGVSSVTAAILVILMGSGLFSLFAFQKNFSSMSSSNYESYEKLWKEVDTLEAQGLTKSALQKTEAIYTLAKKSNNAPQIVKSLIYQVKYKQVLQEGGYEKTLGDLEAAMKASSFPTKQLLQSCAAELYWNYYQQNRWQFAQRTQTINLKEDDVSTWDLAKISLRVTQLYKASIENADSLKELPINDFAAILVKGNMSEGYRPSLYDFLANRALDFFMNDEAYLTQPAYKFDITGDAVFQSPENFIRQKIETSDTASGKYIALLILQNLVSAHLNDKVPDALVDIELKRFQFLRNNSVTDLKDSLYLNGLKNLETRFENDSASASSSLAIAQFYLDRSGDYQPPAVNDHQWDKKIALEYCDKVLQKFPSTNAGKNCKAVRESILGKNIFLTLEQVTVPDQPFRGLLQYKNVKQLYFRIIRNTDALRKNPNDGDLQKLFSLYLRQPVLQSWSQSVNDVGDYQQHNVEIKIPGLPLGDYIILGSSDENFSSENNGLLRAPTSVSNLSYISRRNENSYSFYVLNRETGEPIKNPTARIFTQEYNSTSRLYELKQQGTFTGDENGFVQISPATKNMNFKIEFSSGKDTLTSNDFLYLSPGNETQKTKTIRTIFFTDRAIYRPGQTVYFKGIMIQSDGETNALMTQFKTSVELHDVNDQKISSLELTTNDYGSFNGSFTAPSNSLNGEMTIRNSSGLVTISVEEYKRPRFEVTFDTLKGSFRLNDVVNVKGIAKSYSGANIDGADVKYRVVRQARFPIWYGWRSDYFNRFTQGMEITSGSTITNENGEFKISFTAIPDLKIPKKEKPQFDYTVYADVIDINGETHSAEASVTVGYVALNADVDVPENVSKDSESIFKITTQNLSGVFEPAQGTISVYALQQPDRIFRARLWDRPDQFVMTKDEFYKNFPNDVYDNENDFTTWNRNSKVIDKNFDTQKDSVFSAKELSSLPQGKYLLELITKDKYGEEMKVEKYFTLYSSKEKDIPLQQTLWNSNLPITAKPGEALSLQMGTAEKDLNVIYELQAKDNFQDKKIIAWKKGKEAITIPVSEDFKGGFNVSVLTVKHGRVYSFSQNVSVPYADRKLKLEFETFRNKLLPGQNEEWKIKISGPKGEAVAAEMVAAMYDASLDAFKPHEWNFNLFENNFYPQNLWTGGNCFGSQFSFLFSPDWNPMVQGFSPEYDQLNWFGFYMAGRRIYQPLQTMSMNNATPQAMEKEGQKDKEKTEPATEDTSLSKAEKNKSPLPENLSIRKNLQETAFFYPELQTDSSGNVIIKFTIPEALTRWKFLGFAHTKDLKYGMITKETITQKDLMVTPNAPRFFRVSDTIYFAAKVTNLSDHDLNGNATLQLFDATSMKPVDASFANAKNAQSFSAMKGQSISLSWKLMVPEGIDAVDYKVIAIAGNQSDGEENVLPVLTNKTLVTETLPLNIRGNTTKNYTFTKLLQSASSSTLKNYNLTLEVTSNPAWYAVQALPYMMEYPYECSEQTFNRFYSNALASHIANSNPKISQVFDQWKNSSTDALLSNLEKNQELKSLLLEETPWVTEAKDESERKKRVALLFDLNRMSNEMDAAMQKLQQAQMSNGGWAWFPGMPDDRYITQYIITGFGHLDHLGITNIRDKSGDMINRGIQYMDTRILEDYENLKKNKTPLDQDNLSYYQIQYLYARSFFKDIPVSDDDKKAFDYYFAQAKKYWLKNNIYSQGMIALALNRYGENKIPAAIIKSLKENSITDDETGMYWKSNNSGYFWYEAPVETQALLIETFDELTNDQISVDNMKLWLLKQKQTQDWKTTKATAEAVYALLLKGSAWLMNEPDIVVSLGNQIVDLAKVSKEAGTGYFKTSWSGNEVNPEMGNIKITSTSNDNGVSWGAVYWQYFENLDKITSSATPLNLQKKLFVQHNTDRGPVIEPITDQTILKPGDLVKVRIELRVDRDMEYVHMKDMRAACFEPLNVLSGYKWQDGLGYYEETKDASTNFFFDHLSKGTYVFEYPLRAQLIGDFSNGITSIQCMYAPEFTSHSEGVRVKVK